MKNIIFIAIGLALGIVGNWVAHLPPIGGAYPVIIEPATNDLQPLTEFQKLQYLAAQAQSAPERQPTFADGVRYGITFYRQHPYEDRITATVEGASNLWVAREIENGTNLLSMAYSNAYPRGSFDDGVDIGVSVIAEAIRRGVTNLPQDQLRVISWARRAQLDELRSMSIPSVPPPVITNQGTGGFADKQPNKGKADENEHSGK